MAWSTAVFRSMVTDALDNTYAWDFGSDTFKAALFNNDFTPDKDATSANSIYGSGVWLTGDEVVDATNWVAGGRSISGTAWTNPSSGVAKLDGSDTAGGGNVTIADAYGCQVYNTSLSNRGLSFHSFGGVKAVTGGTFTIVWHASGIITATV